MPASKSEGSRAAHPNGVLGLDHIVLRVRDLGASIDFYKRILGARIERQLLAPRIVQLRIGDSLLDLVPAKRGKSTRLTTGANLDHFAVRVVAFNPLVLARKLKRYGIVPGAVADRYGALGYGPSIYFEDLDGNTIEFKGPATRSRIRR